jgi:transposase-like protein
MLAVRWYLRFGLSYRDAEELRTEGLTKRNTAPQRSSPA